MLYEEKRPNIRKVPKKSSDRLKVPKHSKKTKEQIEKTSIIEKAKWELKIMELQEKMFETPVTIEFLKHIAKYFQPAHYEEVVIERKSLNICGYPLCNKKTQQLKGKYKLSSSKGKIFDITELKSYCGSDCMISSRYFASQLLDEPIYLRNLETIKEVDVIPLGVNIEEWILKENEKLNTYTERSLDSYVKSMMKSLPNLNKNLVIHEHFDDKSKLNSSNQSVIEKSSFKYDSIEGYQYKPQSNNQRNIVKPSTIILDKDLIKSYSNSVSDDRDNKKSLKESRSKEKIISSVIMNKKDADKFNELYQQYAEENKKNIKDNELPEKEKISNNYNNGNMIEKLSNTEENEEIVEKINKLKIDEETTEQNYETNATEKKDEEIVDGLNNLAINSNEKKDDINSYNKDLSNIKENERNQDNNITITRKDSVGILKKSDSVSKEKENLKVRFNDNPKIKIIENKEEMKNTYQASKRKMKNNKKKGSNSQDVFKSYDVIEKNGVKKDVIESNINKNEKEDIIDNNENDKTDEDDPEKKIKSLFEMNKDLEKILKITKITKEEAKKKQKKKLVPTLSLFGKIWTNISSMITNETRLYLNNKVTEDELNEMLMVDDEIMNTRKDILITNIMKSFSSIKLEHGITTSIEDELILLIKSFIVSESMVVLSSVEYWILTVVFLKALTKRNKIFDEEITEEKWKEMLEAVDIPFYQLNEFVNLFN